MLVHGQINEQARALNGEPYQDPDLDKGQEQDSESRKMVGTAARIAVLTLVSRIMALVRDICMASLLGAGPMADCLYAALRLPHAGRRLLAEGSIGLGLTSGLISASRNIGSGVSGYGKATVPQNNHNLLLAADHDPGPNWAKDTGQRNFPGNAQGQGQDDLLEGANFARLLFALAMAAGLVLLVPTAFFLFFPGLLASLLAPGLDMQGDLSAMLRLALPYLPLAGLAGIAMAALHARGQFFLAACSPCVFNLVFILAAFLALGLKYLELADINFTALFLAATMSLAGLAQAGMLWFGAIRSGSALPFRALVGEQENGRYKKNGQEAQLHSPLPIRLAWRLLSRTPKAMAGAAAAQLFTLMAMILASAQGSGEVTALYFAERLVELPLGLVGVGLGLASLPALSRLALSDQDDRFAACLADSLAMALLLSLPACLGLAAIASWIVPLFFAHGAFDQKACDQTVLALLAYLPGLPGMALGRGLLSGVTALGRESRAAWATMISLLCLPLFYAILLACLPNDLSGMAPALAASLAIWGHAGLLWRCVNRNCDGKLARHLAKAHGASIMSAMGSGLVAGLAAWLVICLVPAACPGWTGGKLEVAGMVFMAIIIAMPAWLVSLWLCKNRSLGLLLTSLKHKKRI